jgi:pyruvate carboxylase subunit B
MYSLSINDNNYDVIIREVTEQDVKVEVNGVEHIVDIREIKNVVSSHPISKQQASVTHVLAPSTQVQPVVAADPGGICSPMPGNVLKIYVEEGEKVLAGQKLLVLEAMKLENNITSTHAGVVKKILVREGQVVNQGQSLIVVE